MPDLSELQDRLGPLGGGVLVFLLTVVLSLTALLAVVSALMGS